MHCLSIRQPHLHLILQGIKRYENRDWRYLPKIRGWVALHAGLKIDPHDDNCPDYRQVTYEEIPVGGILGIGFIADAFWLAGSGVRDRHATGPVCIEFSQAIELPKPIRCDGKLGFFAVNHDHEKSIMAQVRKLGVKL